MNKKNKEYHNNELTILWQPSKCIHSEICVHSLPQVYDPNAKPWINAENATTDELINQINKCPSGALSYHMKNQINPEETSQETKLVVIKNGPLIVHGNLIVCDAEGNEVSKGKRTSFCRCGHSNNKPYCDGAHKKMGFEG